ncbi:MAG: HEAT repeat domain-containing protein [Cyanobacteriota bacterium]|nr:HEAT repeat domain-containing protein [Cyanobacteriota bacterium]
MYEDAFSPLEPLDELPPDPPAVDVEGMLAQLEHPNPRLRMQAARIFCDQEEPRSIRRLVELLRDPCTLVRVSAAYALGRNPAAEAVPELIQAMQRDWNGYVRKGVVWALGNTRDPQAIPVLREALQTDITAVRLWAASALGQLAQLATPSAQEQVIQVLVSALLADPVAAVRSNCAWALGKVAESLKPGIDQTPLWHSLEKSVQEDPDWGVRDDATFALHKRPAREEEDGGEDA